jgi:hypothetical protein
MNDRQNLAANRGTWLVDSVSELKTVGASQTLAELLGVTIGVDVEAATVYTAGTVNYNPAGEADATNGLVPVVYTLYGKSLIATAEFFASSVDMTIILHTRASDINGIG